MTRGWSRRLRFSAPTEEGGGRGRSGRCCCFVHSAVGCRSLSLPPPSHPGWRAWCLEPPQAGGAVRGPQGRWPGLSAAQPLRAPRFRPPPSPSPSSRASGLWRDGIPWWFYHTLNPHTFHSSRSQRLSVGSWEQPGNKGGGAESARLEPRT